MVSKNRKVLIVENNMVLTLLYESYMEAMGFDVLDHMVYGKNAIEMAKKSKPDLILMDILLEGSIDGIEAMKEIRKFSDAALIYITGHSDDEKLKRAAETDYLAYLDKPVSFESLRNAVGKAFEIPETPQHFTP